jgi:hypothetical protein
LGSGEEVGEGNVGYLWDMVKGAVLYLYASSSHGDTNAVGHMSIIHYVLTYTPDHQDSSISYKEKGQ